MAATGTTVLELLARVEGTRRAILAPGRPPLDFAGLVRQIGRTAEALAEQDVRPGDAVGIVLPNGPEMASTFLAVSACAVAAPLNPAYRAEEFTFYLEDLQAKALILARGADTPARAVAESLGLVTLEAAFTESDPAGVFTLERPGDPAVPGAEAAFNGPEDVALVLHTSGTTSRPKIVPLTQRNLVASARSIGATLRLSPDDLCLNVMPLFHIHGLIAAVTSSLVAGGGIVCTPGFNALRFFSWMKEFRPTWYTAVPTMHQAILDRAVRNRDVIEDVRLRFIRSSSASLPVPVLKALEQTFRCPVIESYGMTEATHQMASNPLPPAPRKPGTVGLAAGPQIAVMSEDGRLLDPGEIGEVVIRGESVTRGYQNNPKANAEAFAGGWFRTGDQGVIDREGYLTITGRLKEIINRGGEKISPREVDDVLMEHPAVAQAVTFAMPHEKLGEEVGAVIVLKDGVTADEKELRTFAAKSLADFKVPRRILIVDEIPKGATGKLQRIGLAEKLGITA